MSTNTTPQPSNTRNPDLQTLIGAVQYAIDHATADRLPHAVGDALRQHANNPLLLTPSQREGNDDRYTRHILFAHPLGHFTMVALIWKPGQMTPVHGHYTWCAYSMLAGTLEEQRFDWCSDIDRAVLRSSVTHGVGDAVSSHAGLEGVHRIRNSGDTTAISIHVYGIDGTRVATHVNRLAEAA